MFGKLRVFALGAVTVSFFAMGVFAPAQEPARDPAAPAAEEPPRFEDAAEVEADLPAVPPAAGIATRLPVMLLDLPLSVAVVPSALTREQNVFVLGDALRNASGVNVGTGFGVFDFFTIRGFDSLATGLVLTDGVPEPETPFYPLYNVQQVEVLKGPAAFLYGGNPLAGAVQLVRKQPQARRFADLSFSYGRFGTFAGAVDGNTATADGKLALRLNAAWQGSDSYRDLPDGVIQAVNPAVTWRPDGRTRVAFTYDFARSEWPPDSGIPFVGAQGTELAPVPRTRSYQSPFDGSVQDVHRLRFDFERRLGGRVTLRNRAYLTTLEWDSDGTLINGAFPLPGAGGRTFVFRTLVQLDDRQKLMGDQLELLAAFETGSVKHDLLVGLELSRFTDRFAQDVASIAALDLLDPLEQPGVPAILFRQVGDSRSLVLAPYVVDRLSFAKQVQAFLGARLDTLDYDDPPTRTARDATELSPLAGLVFRPSERLSLYASGGVGFAPPSTQVVGPREPERSRQIEIGGKVTFLGGKAFAGAAVYQLERDRIAVPDTGGLTRQQGDQRSRGFELDFSAEPRPGLVAYAAYAFADSRLTRFSELVFGLPTGPFVADRSGNRAAFAPRHLASAWVSKHWGGGFGVAGGLRFVSAHFVGEDNRFAIGGHATLDAAAWYKLGRARFSVNARNLGGTEYATRGFGGVSAIPARPFEILGRVELRLGAR